MSFFAFLAVCLRYLKSHLIHLTLTFLLLELAWARLIEILTHQQQNQAGKGKKK